MRCSYAASRTCRGAWTFSNRASSAAISAAALSCVSIRSRRWDISRCVSTRENHCDRWAINPSRAALWSFPSAPRRSTRVPAIARRRQRSRAPWRQDVSGARVATSRRRESKPRLARAPTSHITCCCARFSFDLSSVTNCCDWPTAACCFTCNSCNCPTTAFFLDSDRWLLWFFYRRPARGAQRPRRVGNRSPTTCPQCVCRPEALAGQFLVHDAIWFSPAWRDISRPHAHRRQKCPEDFFDDGERQEIRSRKFLLVWRASSSVTISLVLPTGISRLLAFSLKFSGKGSGRMGDDIICRNVLAREASC